MADRRTSIVAKCCSYAEFGQQPKLPVNIANANQPKLALIIANQLNKVRTAFGAGPKLKLGQDEMPATR